MLPWLRRFARLAGFCSGLLCLVVIATLPLSGCSSSGGGGGGKKSDTGGDGGDDGGNGDTGPFPLTPKAMLALGQDHSCALNSEGRVRCWGVSSNGRLGAPLVVEDGDLTWADLWGDTYVPLAGDAAQIVAGQAFNCALLTDGDVRCWGIGSAALGVLRPVSGVDDIGGDELPDEFSPVDLGGRATSIAAGLAHACAILEDHTVRCWGVGTAGQLGLGSTDSIGDDETPASVGPVDFGEGTPVQVSAGQYISCVLLDSGRMRCWGAAGNNGYATVVEDIGDDETPAESYAEYDLTGDVDTGQETITAIATNFLHTCALDSEGGVFCFGVNDNGELGSDDTVAIADASNGDLAHVGAPATAIGLGWAHTCAVLEGGAVKCWGQGALGQLGYGNPDNVGDGENLDVENVGTVDLGDELSVIQVSGADHHTCALMSDDAIRCWGNGVDWQLGYGLGAIGPIGDDETPAEFYETLDDPNVDIF